MEVILVDTSVWVNVFRGIATNASIFLRNNQTNIVVATCPVIIQEVLQGLRSETDHATLSSYFNNMEKLMANSYKYAYEAADLYRDLRKKGITIRKPNDCLIAVYAIKNNIALLHDDKDFTNIAAFSDLRTVPL